MLPGCLLRQRIPRIQDIDGRHMPASGKPAEIVEKLAPDLRAADDREDVHDALAMGLDGREDGGGHVPIQDVRFAFRWTRRTGGMRGRDGQSADPPIDPAVGMRCHLHEARAQGDASLPSVGGIRRRRVRLFPTAENPYSDRALHGRQRPARRAAASACRHGQRPSGLSGRTPAPGCASSRRQASEISWRR